MFSLRNIKCWLSIAVSEKKNFFGGRSRQEILNIEICTWNKKTNFFLIFIRLPSEVLKIIKKY